MLWISLRCSVVCNYVFTGLAEIRARISAGYLPIRAVHPKYGTIHWASIHNGEIFPSFLEL